MNISLITVNFNKSDATIKLLESLKQGADQDFEMIVVDNASEKSDVVKLESWINANYPQVKLIKSEVNSGFAGGNNVALSQTFQNGSDWAVLVNNDTWADRVYIEPLKAVLETKKGIVGLPLREGEKTAFGGKIAWVQPTLPHAYEPIPPQVKDKYYAIGGHLAISCQAYEKIGGLDEKYFLYFEDIDYTFAARKKGIDVSFETSPSLHHALSLTTVTLGSGLLLHYHYRNALYFNDKFGDKLLTSLWGFFIFIKQILKIILGHNRAFSKAILAGVWDYWLSRMGKIK
jgi:GT2 family glycosyltransferase